MDEEGYHICDKQIRTIEEKNNHFRKMLEYSQKTFVAHRFGTNFADIGEISVLSPIIKEEFSFFNDISEKKRLLAEIERLKLELMASNHKNEELIKMNEELKKNNEELQKRIRSEEQKRKRRDDDSNDEQQSAKKRRID